MVKNAFCGTGTNQSSQRRGPNPKMEATCAKGMHCHCARTVVSTGRVSKDKLVRRRTGRREKEKVATWKLHYAGGRRNVVATQQRQLLTIRQRSAKHANVNVRIVFTKIAQNTKQRRNHRYTLFPILCKFVYVLCSQTEDRKAVNTIPAHGLGQTD